jgi:aldehyde dehydrogenase (NAD+)
MSVTTYQNYIGGEWVAAKSGETFESRSPADADVLLGRFAASGAVDVDAAVTAASDARASWRRTSAIARANILHKAAEILASRVNDVGRELTIEEGKTLKEGIGETGRAVQILRYYAGEAQQPDGEHYPSANPNTLLYTMREPVGVVGVITPWNFPIAIPAWKIAPALGDPLIDDDRVTAISFTGSEPVGRSVAKRISARGGKVQLELGGKNPAIVFADADLDHAVNHLVSGAMWSSGQKCTATSRALLDASIADEVTRRLTERIGNLATGDPLADSTQVGPVISDEAVKRILGDIESAESEGARLLAGGSKLEGDGRERGNFVAPTLFGEMNPDSRFGQEEVFGPVLGITTVKDMDEALEIANSVRFGLSASIFTSDLGKAMHFINGIDAGIVHVNAETPGAEPQVPFGGYKSSSSYSREQGKSARDFYTQIKTVYVDLPSPA